MRVLTEDAALRCDHGGAVRLAPRQDWVTIAGRRVLVEEDPLGRPVAACPFSTPTTPPCTRTVSVDEGRSYAAFVAVRSRGDSRDRRLCLEGTTGKTNWGQVASVSYTVAAPGQDLVAVESGG